MTTSGSETLKQHAAKLAAVKPRHRITQAFADTLALSLGRLGVRISNWAHPEVVVREAALAATLEWMGTSLQLQTLPPELAPEFLADGVSPHELDLLLLHHASLMADEPTK